MHMFNTGRLHRYGQQFPCILRIVSTKSLLSSRDLHNVNGVLNRRRMRTKLSEAQRAKREKGLNSPTLYQQF